MLVRKSCVFPSFFMETSLEVVMGGSSRPRGTSHDHFKGAAVSMEGGRLGYVN